MTALFAITIADWHPAAWLAVFCAPLLFVTLLLGWMPRQVDDIGEIRIGNPLLQGDSHTARPEAQTLPLLHLSRSLGDAEFRPLVTGMRHLSVNDATPLLRRKLKSNDPELQLFAQCVMQDGQRALQERFQMLSQKATAKKSPAILASFLEAALALVQSPLTPVSEHTAIAAKAQEILSPRVDELTHPRALHAASRFFLQFKRPDLAGAMHARLPAGSPLHTDLISRISHVASIQNPPPLVGPGYHVS